MSEFIAVRVGGKAFIERLSKTTGRVVEPENGFVGPEMLIASIAARGYWEPMPEKTEGGPGSGRYPKGSGKQVEPGEYYHGSSDATLDRIMAHGIIPQNKHNFRGGLYTGARAGKVFLCKTFMGAKWYGRHAAMEVHTPFIVVFRVQVPHGAKAELDKEDVNYRSIMVHKVPANWIKSAVRINIQTGETMKVRMHEAAEDDVDIEGTYYTFICLPPDDEGDVQEGLERGIIQVNEDGPANEPRDAKGQWTSGGKGGALDPNEFRDYKTMPQHDPDTTTSDQWRNLTGEKTAAVVNMDRDLDMTELGSVMDYTGNGNGSINRWLKGYDVSAWREPADVEKLVGHIDSAMKVSQTSDNIALFRGVSFEKMRKLELIAEQKGTFTDKGFVSCTTQKDITSDFGHSIKILVPKGFPAISVPRIASNKAWENEVILNRGVTFKVDIIKAVVPGRSIPEQLIILRPMNKGHHG